MAKVTGAFGGFHTTHQIGKTYVFFLWKGLNVVRTWVKPNNPNTAAQQGVRVNFEDLVDEWHAVEETAIDKQAWERAAGAIKYKPQSGFNRFIGLGRQIFQALATNSFLRSYLNTSTGAGTFQFDLLASNAGPTDVHTYVFGTAVNSLIYSDTGSESLGTVTYGPTATGLPVGTKIYFKGVHRTAGGDLKSESGIYTETLT